MPANGHPHLCATATPAAALRSSALLGEAVGVCLRLRAGSEQVKGAPDGIGRAYIKSAKSEILAFYSTHIVASKVAVPEHSLRAFDDFVADQVTEQDLSSTFAAPPRKDAPSLTEVALPIATRLFTAVKVDVGPHAKPLLNPVLSASRSSNAATRTKASDFFSALSTRIADDDAAKTAVVEELLAILKAGKAATPEARTSSISCSLPCRQVRLRRVPPSSKLTSLLAKETQEASMHAAVSAIAHHLRWLLAHADTVPAASVSARW